MKQTYKEYRESLKEEQSKLSTEEVKEAMAKQSEFMAELDNLKPQEHIWIDRGAKLTCENAAHPYHEAWKRR